MSRPKDWTTIHIVGQRENGSWINEDRKWMEGDANLATAFALLSLSYCREK